MRKTALALALLCLACGDRPGTPTPTELRFVDGVDVQAGQVTSSRVDPGAEAGLELLGAGWRRDGGMLRMPSGRSHLSFFAAGSGVAGLALDAASGTGAATHLEIRVNGTRAAEVELAGRRQLELAFPAGTVRAGWNHLLLADLTAAAGSSPIEVYRLRFLDAAGRPLPEGGHIERHEAGFTMPGGSRLDLVAELAGQARWDGGFEVAAGGPDGEARVRATLLAEGGEARTLYDRGVTAGGAGSFDLDLAAWGGRLARLRLAVEGAGAAVRWHDSRLRGAAGSASPVRTLDAPEPPPRSGRLGRPDIVVVLLDAARGDAFGAFGGPHPTPAVDALAAAGSRFSTALAAAPWTGQSVPAILTGHHPDALGIAHWGSRLPPAVARLPELLAAAGYHTVLFSQHPLYRYDKPLRRGFADFHAAAKGRTDQLPTAEQLLHPRRPTFALVHLLPPHNPYSPPAPFRGAYSGWYRGNTPIGAEFLNGFPALHAPSELTPEDRRYVRDRYLEMAAFADHLVGRLVELLTAAGRFDDTLVVVTSDHGEAFLEHGSFLHTRNLYQELLAVPLVVKWPAGAGGFAPHVAEPVSLVDLAPTLVDGLGLDSGPFQGRSLLPRVFDGGPPRPGVFAATRGVARGERPPQPSATLLQDGWKLIADLRSHRLELYDLAADPGEQHNLARQHPVRAELLLQGLRRQRHLNERLRRGLRQADAEPGEIDTELSEQLRALGYL